MSDNLSHNIVEYSVSEISFALKKVVEEAFGYVRMRGEISGYRGPHSSGHCYFTLKDNQSTISAVMWRGSFQKLAFRPEDGLEVVVTGRVTTYPGRSNYQIVVESMEVGGAGALMALLEKRKAQLQAEGLFAPERKKPLPFMPKVIGVITSPTGAVIRDILHRLRDRFPCHVLLWPVAVQGEGAAEQVAAAISGFNRGGNFPKPDVLIVARGGGSIEDLWAFNEEVVVRAVAASAIPLISAVGHETDTTLIDYVSDKRAPTPTAAAEMAVPVLAEWRLTVGETGQRLARAMNRAQQVREERFRYLARMLPPLSRLLEQAQMRLDDYTQRLEGALPKAVLLKERALAAFRISPLALERRLQQGGQDVERLAERLNRSYLQGLKNRERHVADYGRLMNSLNYERILERGFVLVRNAEGQLLDSVEAARNASRIALQFKDGNITAQVEEA